MKRLLLPIAVAWPVLSGCSLQPATPTSAPPQNGGPAIFTKADGAMPSPVLRAQARLEDYRDELGRIPHDAMMRAKAAVAALPAAGTAGGLDSSKWTNIGPGNIGGRIRTIAQHPSSSGTVFIGSVSGGIWRTNDAGASWARVDDNMGNLAITTILFDPSNPRTMYAATGEGFRNQDAIRGAGIFKSVDSGASWARLASTNRPEFHFVNRISISANGRVLLAACNSGLWRSTDGGSTWANRLPDPSNKSSRCLFVRFKPGSNTLAVADHYLTDNSTTRVDSYAVYTTDAGLTWRRSNVTQNMPRWRRIELAWHAGYTGPGNGVVYAQQFFSATETRLYRSSDGGATYTLVSKTTGNASVLADQGWYDNALLVAPYPRDANHGNDLIVAGGVRIWRSTDGGGSWTDITGIHVDQHAIVADSGYNGGSNRRVWVGNDGGIYRADDIRAVSRQSGWTTLNNDLRITQFYGGTRHARTGIVYGGTQDNGTEQYDPARGANGWRTSIGGDGSWVASDPQDSRFFYGAYQYAGVHRSSDGGLTADSIYGGQFGGNKGAPYEILDAKAGSTNFISSFVIDPKNPQRLLVGCQRLWRTSDARTPNTPTTGPRWAAIKARSASGAFISAIAVDPTNSNVVWVGHNDGDLYSTTNGTAANPSWTKRDGAALPNRKVTRIVFDPADPRRMFLTFGSYSKNNVWVSTNSGGSWAPLASVPEVPCRDIEVHPSKSSWLYLATEVGLLVSENNGVTWTGAATPADVSIDETFWSSGSLYLATHGRGFFHQKPDDGALKADLTISAFSVQAGPTWNAGERHKFSATIKNIGRIPSVGTTVAVLLSRDSTIATQSDDLLDTHSHRSLAPNQTQTISFDFGTPHCLSGAGNWYVGAYVDALHVLDEANENNNGRADPTPRPIQTYSGGGRWIDYLDPRAGNTEGPAWRGFASWSANKGLRAKLCAYAPRHKGDWVALVMSGTPAFTLDVWTAVSLEAGFFLPLIVQTSRTTGRAEISQVMPKFQTTIDLRAYVHSAWFTPTVSFTALGNNSLTNEIRK